MHITAIRIDVPPEGELETSAQGIASPTGAQVGEETDARQKFLDSISPYFESLPQRPPSRKGNITRVELLGSGMPSQLNRYLLLLTYDLNAPGIEELSAKLPPGSQVSVVGEFDLMQAWDRT
jgi:hypothetical protein